MLKNFTSGKYAATIQYPSHIKGTPTFYPDNSVQLLFNSEYELVLKNDDNSRVLAKVFIDGENVTAGGLIIDSRGFAILERPVDKPRKFLFVSSDSGQAYDAGKSVNNLHNGIIKVEFYSEVEQKPVKVRPAIHSPINYPEDNWYDDDCRPRVPNKPWKSPPNFPGPKKYNYNEPVLESKTCCQSYGATRSASPVNVSSRNFQESRGCTVSGSASNQQFVYHDFRQSSEPPIVIQFKLIGY
jgi:hypothetical protein